MRILGLASNWTLGCAILGLLVLPASHAGAASTTTAEHRRVDRDQASAASGWQSSRGLILAAAMTDRLRPSNALGAAGSGMSDRDDSPDRAAGRHRGRSSRDHGRPEMVEPPEGHAGRHDRGHRSDTASSPIPEPSSILLFAAGAGLVAFIARRKLR